MTKTKPSPVRAFPVVTSEEHNGGMWLRDYFAAAALTGILARHGTTNSGTPSTDASDAYAVADAMMSRREM